ncbi:phage tail-collar fiber domain-containing protein [Psychrobacter aquimaris]|uniref:phage tail-collar fiber domain-containing protein n=1 Tax=Psychrobacter aquimaris TaxID=292733 RepID=UPI0018DF81B8|nr:phage tail protein [Psychrobacter aquimaris]
MPQPIIFTITEAGKQAALNANADSAQLKINLTQVAVGTAQHLATGNETALTSEVKRGSIVSGDIEVVSNTLRFTTSMSGDTKTDVYEVGLFTDDGVLFALAGSNTTPLFSLHPDITFVIGFGLSLQDVAADSVTVSTDPNGALSVVIMEQHLAAPNPHPQYAKASDIQDHIDDPDAHEQYLKTSDFVDDHLNHVDPHDQYVLDVEHDQDMDDIAQEQALINQWQNDHLSILNPDDSVPNPHPQYVLKSMFNQAIAALNQRINELAETAGVGAVLGRIDVTFTGETNGYSQVNSTIARVNFTLSTSGSFNLVRSGAFANTFISDFECQPASTSRRLELNYPAGYDPLEHEVRSNNTSIAEKVDGTGITFYVPYTSDTDVDGAKKYTVNATYYFEIVKI